jgi:leucyl-tRNA synthetase
MQQKVMIALVSLVVGALLATYFHSSNNTSTTSQTTQTATAQVATTRTKITDKVTGERVTIIEEEVVTFVEESQELKVEVRESKPDWSLGLQYGLIHQDYKIRLERRIIGNLYAGGYVGAQGEAGLSLSYTW